MSFLSFFKVFVSDWKQTGSVVPSSPSLIKSMLKSIDFSNTNFIIELGPGTGVITKEILKRMHPDARLLVIESNPVFCKILEQYRDSRLKVVHDYATELEKYCNIKPEVIISGIPFSNIPKKDSLVLLNKIGNALSERGEFIQFQYSLGVYSMLRKIFTRVSLSFVLFNIPPAFVYHCTPKDGSAKT